MDGCLSPSCECGASSRTAYDTGSTYLSMTTAGVWLAIFAEDDLSEDGYVSDCIQPKEARLQTWRTRAERQLVGVGKKADYDVKSGLCATQ